jgi:hypothetical protein
MADGPTLPKLIILLVVLTTLYILFILPLMTTAYYAVTGGNMKTWTDKLSKKLKFI